MRTKVAFITPSLGGGGLERVAIRLANIGGEKVELYLISTSSVRPFYDIDDHIKLYQYPDIRKGKISFFTFILKLLWLRRTIKLINPKVVCCFGERYNPFFVLALLGFKSKIFLLNRASPLTYLSGFRGMLLSFAYRFSYGVIFQTQTAREIVSNRFALNNTFVLGNPLDLTFPIKNRENIILNVGSFSGGKNQKSLLNIFKNIVDSGINNWELHFVGDGPNLNSCKQKMVDLDLEGKVFFHGQIKNVKELYVKSEIFAFVSRSEGFPNALAEAMAAGCACIAYDCVAGPSDLIKEGYNGILVPLDNEEIFVYRLNDLISDKRRREMYSSNGILEMKKYEMDLIAQKFYKYILY